MINFQDMIAESMGERIQRLKDYCKDSNRTIYIIQPDNGYLDDDLYFTIDVDAAVEGIKLLRKHKNVRSVELSFTGADWLHAYGSAAGALVRLIDENIYNKSNSVKCTPNDTIANLKSELDHKGKRLFLLEFMVQLPRGNIVDTRSFVFPIYDVRQFTKNYSVIKGDDRDHLAKYELEEKDIKKDIKG